MQGKGFLAIWSDISPDDETDYLHWLAREHTSERVSTDGFLAVRVFRSHDTAIRRYFILYELEHPNVVGGGAYLARLNAPTPWSQRIMPRLGNFIRGGGRIVASAGVGQGGFLAPLVLDIRAEFDAEAVARDLAQLDRVAAVRVLLTDTAQTSIETREKSMRSADRSFAGLLLIEGLDERAVHDALAHVRGFTPRLGIGSVAEMPLYAACFGLHRRLLPQTEVA